MKSLLKFAALGAAFALGTGASAASLTTTFASNNGYNGNMFDIAIGASDILVQALELNIAENANVGVAIYMKSGSYVGSENDMSAWTLLESSTIVGLGEGMASGWDLADFNLSANETYGIYVTTTGGEDMNYTNGTAAGNVAASNGDLTIFEGIGKEYPFDASFDPRVWNGTIEYSVSDVPLPAGLPLLAAGLFGLGMMRRRKG